MSSKPFIMKPYRVTTEGLGLEPASIIIAARSRPQAMVRAWHRAQIAIEIGFGDFVRAARAHREVTPAGWGREIRVRGRLAYELDRGGDRVAFVRPFSDIVTWSHINDVRELEEAS